MAWNSRSVRIKRIDKLLKTRNRRNIVENGGDCPTITLSDLDTNIMFTSGDFACVGTISEGSIQSLEVQSGAIPPNTELVWAADQFGILLDGGTTTFGTYNFTLGGTGDNGCPITPKAFTIEVWAQFEKAGTPFSDLNSSILFDNISGLPTSLGTGVQLVSLELNASVGSSTLADMTCLLADLGDIGVARFFNESQLTGTALTNTVFSINGVGLISEGTPPYTFTYSDSQVLGSFAAFDGANPNDGFLVNLHQEIGTGATGGLVTGILIFKPI